MFPEPMHCPISQPDDPSASTGPVDLLSEGDEDEGDEDEGDEGDEDKVNEDGNEGEIDEGGDEDSEGEDGYEDPEVSAHQPSTTQMSIHQSSKGQQLTNQPPTSPYLPFIIAFT